MQLEINIAIERLEMIYCGTCRTCSINYTLQLSVTCKKYHTMLTIDITCNLNSIDVEIVFPKY